MKTWSARLWYAFLFLFPAIFMAVGGGMAWVQHQKVATYQPVAATVLDASIATSHSNKGGTTYRPVVKYTYAVGGQTYQNDDVYPVTASASHAYAKEAISRFPIGATVTAYHDPADPGSSFLIPHHTFFPYIFFLAGSAFAGFLVMGGISLTGNKLEPARGSGPWFPLKAESSIEQRVSSRWLGATVMGAGILGIIHYFSVEPDREALAWWASGIYVGLMLIPLGLLLHAWLVSRKVEDAVVEIDRYGGVLGQPLGVRVTLPLRKGHSGTLKAAVVLERAVTTGSGKSRSTHREKAVTLDAPPVDLAGAPFGQPARVEFTVVLPAEAEPSSQVSSANPHYAWRVEVRADMPGADYAAAFPFAVSRD